MNEITKIRRNVVTAFIGEKATELYGAGTPAGLVKADKKIVASPDERGTGKSSVLITLIVIEWLNVAMHFDKLLRTTVARRGDPPHSLHALLLSPALF